MIANVSILFTVDDKDKRLDYRKVPLFVWEQLEAGQDITPGNLIPKLADNSPKAIVALLWLERKQRERKLTLKEVRAAIDNDQPPYVEIGDILRDGRSIFTRDAVEDDEGEGPTSGSS